MNDTTVQPAEEKPITLVWLNFAEGEDYSRLFTSSLLIPRAEQEALKLKALTKLGIAHDPEYTAYETWLRHLAAINDLPATMPIHRDLVDAISDNRDCMRFLMLMA